MYTLAFSRRPHNVLTLQSCWRQAEVMQSSLSGSRALLIQPVVVHDVRFPFFISLPRKGQGASACLSSLYPTSLRVQGSFFLFLVP